MLIGEIQVKKVIRDGKVAVLISIGYGAGWYSWHGIEELLYDPHIVRILENPDEDEDSETIFNYCVEKYGDGSGYFGGVDGLEIVWIPEGKRFRIEEYDGAESVIFEESITWLTA